MEQGSRIEEQGSRRQDQGRVGGRLEARQSRAERSRGPGDQGRKPIGDPGVKFHFFLKSVFYL